MAEFTHFRSVVAVLLAVFATLALPACSDSTSADDSSTSSLTEDSSWDEESSEDSSSDDELSEEEQRQSDWEDQTGDDWDQFNEAYQTGFDSGCEGLFADSPNGGLYEDDIEYTVTDCQNESPGDASSASDVPSEVPDDPSSAGAEVGELDGCQALFENQGVSSLNYGEDSVAEYDCPVSSSAGTSYSAPSPSPKKPKAIAESATSYRVSKATWTSYSASKQLRLAKLFVANNPRDCTGAHPDQIPPYMATDWLQTSQTANEVMLGFCRLLASGE